LKEAGKEMVQQDIAAPESASAMNFQYPETHQSPILNILVVLARHKLFILGTTLIVMAGVATLTRDSFIAETVILPPQEQQSALAAFMATTPLGGVAGSGLASQLASRTSVEKYVGMLKSHSIADQIIAQFQLKSVYETKFLSDTRAALRKHVTFSSSRESQISISVEDHDPKRAAAIANAFVDALYRLDSRLALTDSAQRRLFFEQRLEKEKDALSVAEIALKDTEHATGLVVPTGQGEMLIRSAAELRAQISSHEVALQAARAYGTDQNPRIEILHREISTMQSQLSKLESDGMQGPRFEVPAGKLPEASLEFIRQLRNLKFHETLYELLAKQYEAALIDEARQAPVIQVVDRATAPDKKSGPPRTERMLGAGLLAIVTSSMLVLMVRYIRAVLSAPENAKCVAALGAAVRFWPQRS
jgi:uncharacterized protein involved in exopolysaccharide biosynthesis